MRSAGFTLIEVLMVMVIMSVFAGILLTRVSRTRTDLNSIALVIMSDVRLVQADANNGRTMTDPLGQPSYRCGYGIHAEGDGYLIYAGPDASAASCAAQNKNYESGGSFTTGDVRVRSVVSPSASVVIEQEFPDIFFAPPNFTTYINNVSTVTDPARITIRLAGGSCPADCKIIDVYTSGKIQLE